MSRGKISLYIGCMFAGKSSAVASELHRHRLAGRQCLLVRTISDDRYRDVAQHDGLVTHDGVEHVFTTVYAKYISEVDVSSYDVVGVDEGQFFDDIITVDEWANNGKRVYVSALDGDFTQTPFGEIHKLIPLCEHVTKLRAVCRECGGSAAFTRRIGDNVEVVAIGGAEQYRAVCRACRTLLFKN